MARLIKEWMKAKKGICSSDCECLTITGWKCYAEEHLCNCGDGSAPVPPTPTTYTYTLEKQTTRGAKDIYTVSKYASGEANPVKVYSLSAEYDYNDEIENLDIGDCTSTCEWYHLGYGGASGLKYVNITEDALTAGTQAAYKSVFDAYDDFYSYDDGYIYILNNGESEGKIFYSFSKISKEDEVQTAAYSLILTYDAITGDLTEAEISWGTGSWAPTPISDSSKAIALKEEYEAILNNFSQSASKRGFDDSEALYNSVQ